MIKVYVDEAYAYDMLSILYVKHDRSGPSGYPHYSIAYSRLLRELGDSVGHDINATITESPEYRRLLVANLDLFDLIGEIKGREGRVDDALRIDGLNHERFKAKQALQARFFPASQLSERKIGYAST